MLREKRAYAEYERTRARIAALPAVTAWNAPVTQQLHFERGWIARRYGEALDKSVEEELLLKTQLLKTFGLEGEWSFSRGVTSSLWRTLQIIVAEGPDELSSFVLRKTKKKKNRISSQRGFAAIVALIFRACENSLKRFEKYTPAEYRPSHNCRANGDDGLEIEAMDGNCAPGDEGCLGDQHLDREIQKLGMSQLSVLMDCSRSMTSALRTKATSKATGENKYVGQFLSADEMNSMVDLFDRTLQI
jgi:hypothetical protein